MCVGGYNNITFENILVSYCQTVYAEYKAGELEFGAMLYGWSSLFYMDVCVRGNVYNRPCCICYGCIVMTSRCAKTVPPHLTFYKNQTHC